MGFNPSMPLHWEQLLQVGQCSSTRAWHSTQMLRSLRPNGNSITNLQLASLRRRLHVLRTDRRHWMPHSSLPLSHSEQRISLTPSQTLFQACKTNRHVTTVLLNLDATRLPPSIILPFCLVQPVLMALMHRLMPILAPRTPFVSRPQILKAIALTGRNWQFRLPSAHHSGL